MKMQKFIFTFFTLLLLSFNAAAQSPLQKMGPYTEAFGEEKPFAQGFYEKATQHQADPQWVMEVLGRAKLMRDQGLPTEPLFLKASEGLTKKVPASRILPALDRTQKQTETAGRLVDQAMARGAVGSPQAKRAAILNYQRALLNEVPPSTLEKLSEGLDPSSKGKLKIERLGIAADEIPKLRRQGIPEEDVFLKINRKLKENELFEKKPEKIEEALKEKKKFEIKEDKEKPKIKTKEQRKEKEDDDDGKFERKDLKKQKSNEEKWEKSKEDRSEHGGGPSKSISGGNGKGHGKGK